MNSLCLTLTSWAYNWQLPWNFEQEKLPDSWELMRHFVFMMFAEDLFYYFTHRLFHCYPFYQLFHKTHHELDHPLAISAEYQHPVEFMFSIHYSFFFGMLLLGNRMHVFTTMIWAILRVLEIHDGHSGYEFPWSIFRLIPFGTDATYHDFHHTRNVGNYSSFMTIWDSVFNTNIDFYEKYPGSNKRTKNV